MKEDKKQALRTRVLEAATQLFSEKGLAFTMDDIAARMHISKKTIYVLFPSKERVIMELAQYAFEAIQRRKAQLLQAPGTAAQRLELVLTALPEEYQGIDFRRLQGLAAVYPAVAAEVERQLNSNWEMIAELLEEGQRDGSLRPIPLTVLRTVVTGTIGAFLSTGELEAAGITYGQALEALNTLIMHGVRRD